MLVGKTLSEGRWDPAGGLALRSGGKEKDMMHLSFFVVIRTNQNSSGNSRNQQTLPFAHVFAVAAYQSFSPLSVFASYAPDESVSPKHNSDNLPPVLYFLLHKIWILQLPPLAPAFLSTLIHPLTFSTDVY